tara:strand:- start:44 stop:898 length:855 start_codon:yes stop_codon:yes gene_type:complete
MLVDLVEVTTSDNVSLDGAFFEPQYQLITEKRIDGFLLIHGSGGHFYSPATRTMAADLSQAGYPCLTLNTRGHDTVWVDNQTGIFHGNAFEILDDSKLDLRAGIDFLQNRGIQRICLLGHSMGAVKISYYAAFQNDPRIQAVIPISPVRLSYSYYMGSEYAEEFQNNLELADEMEANGRALDLMKVNFPIKQFFSAASYLDKHGPGERYNLVDLAPRIHVPILTLAGSLETHTRLVDMASDLVLAAVNSPSASYEIIDGGDHSLQNRKAAASQSVSEWIPRLKS